MSTAGASFHADRGNRSAACDTLLARERRGRRRRAYQARATRRHGPTMRLFCHNSMRDPCWPTPCHCRPCRDLHGSSDPRRPCRRAAASHGSATARNANTTVAAAAMVAAATYRARSRTISPTFTIASATIANVAALITALPTATATAVLLTHTHPCSTPISTAARAATACAAHATATPSVSATSKSKLLRWSRRYPDRQPAPTHRQPRRVHGPMRLYS